MSAPDRACPDYPNECMHPWAHARAYAEVKATQCDHPTPDRLPMPPAEFLKAVTMVGERAAAGYGWQEGYLAGRAAAAAEIRAFADQRERSVKECPPTHIEVHRRNDAVLGAYRRAAEIAETLP